MIKIANKKMPKMPKCFKCDKCDFICSKNSNYEKHLLTKKHINAKNANLENAENAENSKIEIICSLCERSFKHLSSLSRHKKKCKLEENVVIDKNKTINSLDDLNNMEKLTTLFMEVVKSNSELQKQTLEMHQQMLDVCKNSNTTINSHNKTFNMQVFLNEKCKDAMNIMDFVNSMDLQLSDLEELGELGYVEGISRQMIRKLSELDVYKRPIHCSDLKRETIYVRDNGVWEKETITHDKLRKAIKYVTAKNGYLLEPWRDANPQCMNTQHPLNDVYVRIMSQAMGGKGEFFDSENKIIKKVSKVITIDKSDY
jgi:hypothetical protein